MGVFEKNSLLREISDLYKIIEDRLRETLAGLFEYFDQHRDAFYACKPEDFDLALAAVNRENFDGGEISKEALMEWIHSHERGER